MAFCQPFGGRRTAPPIDFAPFRALRAAEQAGKNSFLPAPSLFARSSKIISNI
jgi:hypothetical protein